MTATHYTKILDAALLPFLQVVFPAGYRLQQEIIPSTVLDLLRFIQC